MPGLPQIVTFSPFGRGVDQATTKTFLPAGFVHSAENLVFDRGLVKKRRGFARRTYNNSSSPQSNASLPLDSGRPVLALPNFWPVSGSEVECLINDKFAYDYSFATGNYTTIFKESTTSTNVQCFTTGAPYVSWTPVPVRINHDIKPGVVFTDGLEYDPSGGDPAKHTVYFYDGTQHVDTTDPLTLTKGRVDMTGLTSFKFAKQVIWFADHFLIGDYNDNGDRFRQGVSWGDFQKLGIQSGAASDFGEVIIADAKGTLQRFIRLGASLAIYFTKAIVICDPVPTTDIYDFDVRVQGTGLLGPNAVIDVGGLHFFLGEDNIYVYDGGLAPRAIGSRISELLFGAINAAATDAIVSIHLPRKNEIKWFIPTGSSTTPNAILSYNYREDTMSSIGLMSKNITAAGRGVRNITYRCSDEPFKSAVCNPTGEFTTPDYSDMPASDFSHTKDFPLPTLGSSDGFHYDFDDIHFLEDVTIGVSLSGGNEINAEMITDTKALGFREKAFGQVGTEYGTFGRVGEIYVESRGTVFRLHFSIDDGETWTAIGQDFGGFARFIRQRVPVDIVGRFLTFKFIFPSVGGSTAIRTLGVRNRATSPRGM